MENLGNEIDWRRAPVWFVWMYYADACIICGGKDLVRRPAPVAGFIRHYVLQDNDAPVQVCFCRNCGMFFFDLRFDAAEVQRLYAGYRGKHYVEVREKFEPNYRLINDRIGNNPAEIANRHQFMETVLAKGRIEPKKILDWGGDRGVFVPPGLRKAKVCIYDVSGARPLEGMTTVAQDDQEAPYDLIICTHVLEHMSEPLALTRRLRDLVVPGGHIYFEVPMDMRIQAFLWSRFFRWVRMPLPWWMHEHINFYSRKPITNLLYAAGLELIEYRLQLVDFGWIRFPTIGFLARRPLADEILIKGKAGAGGELLRFISIFLRRKYLK